MTISAASHDRRFLPVDEEELPEIDIEISVLSPLKKIDNIEEIVLGKHGIFIEEGYNTGVFLPQVATETGWSKEEFLGHCARDKAGLDWDGWKTADLFIFTATVFS
jgi:AmmeMemoRadiSam system protein A